MAVSFCRRPAKSTTSAKQANKIVVPELTDAKQKFVTFDEESCEGSDEHLHWEGCSEGNNFVQKSYGEGNNVVRVPSFGISSNAR